MRPAEIARKLGKDKSWVSRAIRKLLAEKETAYATDAERAVIEETNRDFERLIVAAMAVREAAGDTEKGLAAIRAASEVLGAKVRYQLATGQIQRRDTPTDDPANLLKTPLAGMTDDARDEMLLAEAARIRAVRGEGFGEKQRAVSVFDRV